MFDYISTSDIYVLVIQYEYNQINVLKIKQIIQLMTNSENERNNQINSTCSENEIKH